MITLVLKMIWSRRGQAVTLALLALLAVASAVASPAYLIAVDRAIAAGQIATASTSERGLSIAAVQNDREADSGSGGVDFNDVAAALVDLPGFSYVYSAEFPVMGIERTNRYADRLVFRQDACSHLVMVTGRCAVAEGEVVIGVATAKRLGLTAGRSVALRATRYSDDPQHPGYLPDGVPRNVLIAGTYRVDEPGDAYWASRDYFTAVPGLGPGEPVFTDAVTLDKMDHGNTAKAIDGTAGPAALAPAHLDALRAGLTGLGSNTAQLGGTIQITTEMPALLDRIDAGQNAARLLVPVLAVPLVLLACFSIFLAAGYGTEGRRPELAVVALRGSRWWTRWWLATGEILAAVAAGAVAGCLVGQLLVNVVAAARFPGAGGVALDVGSLRYAPFAALAALLAAVLAQRRQLLSPVADLLRRAAIATGGPRALATEAMIVLLAVVATVQLVISGGTLTGVSLLAPAFLILAVAVVAARVLLPAVTRYAGHALGRGNLGVALAAFQLTRRPGAQRLFALLVATVAVAGYAACAVDVAAGGRAVQAGVGVGADRVLDVGGSVFRSQLLAAVRDVDPDGRYAMAVVGLPNAGHHEPPGLAVDATRLAAVASWPSGGPSASRIRRLLHPDAPAPVILAGPDVTVEATGSGFDESRDVRLEVAVSSTTGLGDAVVQLGKIHNGRHRYPQRVDACRQGCRLNGIEIATGSADTTGRLVVNSLGAAGPAARLTDPGAWRMTRYGRLAADPAGLRISLDAPSGLTEGLWVNPIDAPFPLPVAYAGAAPLSGSVTGAGGGPLPVRAVGRLPAVPRLGRHATLVDLEWADRLATDAGRSLTPQVWLNRDAPPDIVARLSARGLTITGDRRSDRVRRQLDRQGAALSLWFYRLAGGLSVLLGAGALVLAAAVDRARRVEDLSALRAQGLTRGRLAWATRWTYPVLVAIAAVVGLVTALIAWLATGWALPLAGVDPPDLPRPAWPGAPAVLGTTGAVFVVLAVVAAATGRELRRRVDRSI